MSQERGKNRALAAHLSMFAACAIWGLMAPVGKDAMLHGIDGLTMVMLRVSGGALLFWTASLFARREHVPLRDVITFAGAAVLGIVTNQCGYTLGLSLTSPINASIVTTSMPIFAMILAAIILKEPLTSKKVMGVFLGCSGALMLILTSATHHDGKVGDIRGDLLCLMAQFSYALYLSLFNRFVKRYSVFTVNKWMFLWATIILAPFIGPHAVDTLSQPIATKSLIETAYVVVFGTFIGYILIINAQQVLRPTVVSVYNYVQPIVAVTVSVAAGIGVLKWMHALAVVLVFTGVGLVIKSRSRRDEINAQK
ncbi:MAG: DMT family transporter [Prevotella sp.]|jgi:drug/metabolite transporter (DMT)-like permease|nr:DMT family transporter [Prevotella sp.]